MIKSNSHKYSISAMCKCLNIARSTYYYEVKPKKDDKKLEKTILKIYFSNRKVYGCRKIKAALKYLGKIVSKRKICEIMKKYSLESAYSKSRYKHHNTGCNEADIPNELNREFNGQQQNSVVVSDLTYVRVNKKWNYICILLDLYNREIIGCSAGVNKDAKLVYNAFASVKCGLNKIQMFHTDRGNEFNNKIIDEVLEAFKIKRSLSLKGSPYDNAVAESTFKIIKSEFVYGRNFSSLSALKTQLLDYINWFNNIRLHSTLGYLSPAQFKAKTI